jgi:hypothetical protein
VCVMEFLLLRSLGNAVNNVNKGWDKRTWHSFDCIVNLKQFRFEHESSVHRGEEATPTMHDSYCFDARNLHSFNN